ncbi:unnamed protein product [Miscanthus lutarioriparius]|uniref:Scarecrow-like protein 9 n=1 Tax=Miscanthus lutarioriparius TaxID=422564 RepID=A0A811S2H5_9POAL|nr:unnamed protein product [Miscanthus lutarioriparius]
MVIESPFDDLYTITTPGQQQDGSSSSSSQQQLTLYDQRLCDPQFFSQSTNESNMQFSGVVTIPGMYNVSSNLGQNHLQIAAGVSPDYQRIRSNNALHHISQILMEDVDERVGSHEGEADLQAAEKAFYDILEQVYPPSLYWSSLHHSGEAGEGPGEGSNTYHKRPRRSSFTTDISSHSMLQSLPAPLSPYSYGRSLFLPYQPLASTGRASRFGFSALQIGREAEDGKGFDKMITDYRNNPYIQDSDTREGKRKNYTITCEISRNEKFDRVLLCYGLDCFIETARLRDMAAKEASKNSPKGQSKTPARQKLRGTMQLKKEVVDLRTLLIHCAQAVAADDRLLAGTPGWDGESVQLFPKVLAKRISDEDLLKVYNFYLAVCPFLRASYTFANQSILEASVGQSKVHIVDIGVCFGFQWPSLIQLFERKLLEGGKLGREILNVVACEGADRIERPETYQQWQARCHKAGFEQLPLDPAIMKLVLWMKKEFYHEDFVADEDNGWLLQGWKGRVLYALSKWKVNESCADQ